MNHESTSPLAKACYNSLSCVISISIIVIILGAIIYDTLITKPELRRNIEEIRIEVRNIHEKINAQYEADFGKRDSLIIKQNEVDSIQKAIKEHQDNPDNFK